jgi:hypothetical protein
MAYSLATQARAHNALREYQTKNAHLMSFNEGACDLITDLLHLADRDEEADADHILYFAKIHFDAERKQ